MKSPNGLPVVYVGRPSKWGNPFRVGHISAQIGGRGIMVLDEPVATRAEAVLYYKHAIVPELFLANLRLELGGKNLACWCPKSEPCHG